MILCVFSNVDSLANPKIFNYFSINIPFFQPLQRGPTLRLTILTSEVDPRTVRVKILIMVLDP